MNCALVFAVNVAVAREGLRPPPRNCLVVGTRFSTVCDTPFFVHTLAASFGNQHPCIFIGQLEDIALAINRQVNAVQAVRKFASETNERHLETDLPSNAPQVNR
jgi:hypothetical protein